MERSTSRHASRKKEKIEYGANFIPSKHIERGTNFSNGPNGINDQTRRTYGTVGQATIGSGASKQYLKIVVIGDSGVGKSSIIESYQYKRSALA